MTLSDFKVLMFQLANTHVKVRAGSCILSTVLVRGRVSGERSIDLPELDWNTDICNCSPLLQLAVRHHEFDGEPGAPPGVRVFGEAPALPRMSLAMERMSFRTSSWIRCVPSVGSISVSRYDREQTYDFLERLWLHRRQADEHAYPCIRGDF